MSTTQTTPSEIAAAIREYFAKDAEETDAIAAAREARRALHALGLSTPHFSAWLAGYESRDAEVVALREERDALNTEAANHMRLRLETEDERDTLRAELAAAKRESERLDSSWMARFREAHDAREEVENELAALKAQPTLRALEEEVDNQGIALRFAQANGRTLKEMTEQLSAERDELRAELAQQSVFLNEEITALRSEIAHANAELATNVDHINAITNAVMQFGVADQQKQLVPLNVEALAVVISNHPSMGLNWSRSLAKVIVETFGVAPLTAAQHVEALVGMGWGQRKVSVQGDVIRSRGNDELTSDYFHADSVTTALIAPAVTP